MADGLTPGYLRQRARYWRGRAAKETDPEKQTRLRQTAEILDREADAIEGRQSAAES
jgi:Holliday junction resolvase-like predicted endonuclease